MFQVLLSVRVHLLRWLGQLNSVGDGRDNQNRTQPQRPPDFCMWRGNGTHHKKQQCKLALMASQTHPFSAASWSTPATTTNLHLCRRSVALRWHTYSQTSHPRHSDRCLCWLETVAAGVCVCACLNATGWRWRVVVRWGVRLTRASEYEL